MATNAPECVFRIEPYEYAEARALADALGLSEPIAITLVRRGFRTPEAARAFLDAAESHDPFELEGMEEVVARVLDAVGAGRAITVHGDYDVDGVSSTAILVGTLRELGGRCDWYIPDRSEDGYGLTEAGVARLADRGTELLITVDCGITSVAEVAAARAAGLEVIVTDHHAPAEALPECPILHPQLGGYPCPDLCATGVAHKLSLALVERAPGDPATAEAKRSTSQDLDLVALATVADLVPLTGENRALVRRGLAEIRRASRPGLRALIEAAGVEPSGLDEGDIAFRLAPRINAVGRLYRADAGVELMLTTDTDRAREIAVELDRANGERRGTEREVLVGAEAALAELPGGAGAPALVASGEGWHPGVVGIVASRLAERHWRPTILIALDGSGTGRGSGRSIPGFDLLAALRDCSEHLGRFGGHRAAAGLEIEAGRIDGFREAFTARVAESLQPDDLVRTETVDAIVGGDRLGLSVAEELERLRPFGIGNPGVRLLVPAARLRDVRPMGDGSHARFSVESGARRALGVAFGSSESSLSSLNGSPVDLSVRLELNQWNGAVEPRVVLKETYPLATEGAAGCPAPAAGAEWWRRFDAERERPFADWPPQVPDDGDRETVDRAPGSGVSALADLVSSGSPVLALCADASRRWELAVRADPRRFGCGPAVHACGRCAADQLAARLAELAEAGSGLALADWAALSRDPDLARGFEHVVLIDPPPFRHLELAAGAGRGYLHRAWEEFIGFALHAHRAEWQLDGTLRSLYAAVRDTEPRPRGEALVDALAGAGEHPRTPELAGRCVRVLDELGLVAPGDEAEPAQRTLGVVSSEGTRLERSAAYLSYTARHEEGERFLSRQRRAEA